MTTSMDKASLIRQGTALARHLEALAEQYHVKSDQHDILLWETAIIRAKLQDLEEHCGLPEHLMESTLLSAWAARLAADLSDLTAQVRIFHNEYKKQR